MYIHTKYHIHISYMHAGVCACMCVCVDNIEALRDTARKSDHAKHCHGRSWKVFHHLSWTASTAASASAAMGRWICGWSADGSVSSIGVCDGDAK